MKLSHFRAISYIFCLFSGKLSHEEDGAGQSVGNRIDERTISMENHTTLLSWHQG